MRIRLIVILAVWLGLSACGGGGGGTAPAPDPGKSQSIIALTTFQRADLVIGQPTFTTGIANQGGSAAAKTLKWPYGNPVVVGGRLYLPDYMNNRVLGFNTIPSKNNAAADFVLGQADFAGTSFGSAANQMKGPQTVKAANGKFFADDYGNHRVLIWNSAPTTTHAPADVVVGQPDFGSMVSSCTRTGMKNPESIEVAGGKLIVADSSNNRVLIWNSIPITKDAQADLVLGQADFTHCAANDALQSGTSGTIPSAKTLNYPSDVWSDGTRLIVADQYNNRVLIWNNFPSSNFAAADVVIGQGDFAHNQKNDDNQDGSPDGSPTARTLYTPYFLTSDGTKLFVTDSDNNRVLVWNSVPSSNFAFADTVLGQGDFAHFTYNDDDQDGNFDSGPTARTLSYPSGLFVLGNNLFLYDNSNNRCLMFGTN